MWVPAYDTAKIPAYARLDRKRYRGEYEPLFPGTGVGRRFGRYLIQYRFLIVGLPLAIVLGLFIGVLNMVPYLQLIGIIPTILLCLVSASDTGVNFWLLFGACILVFIIVQIIEDVFIVPRVMGKVTGLNPAIILLSLSIWGTLLGFVGMFIALPLTTLCLSY